jgi:nodulation protein E
MGASAKTRRVAVTGMGAVTCLGTNVETFWGAVKRGESGIKPISRFPMEHLQELQVKIAGDIRDFDPKEKCRNRHLQLADRYSQMAGAAADEAIAQSGIQTPLADGHRGACIIGSGAGGLMTLDKAYEDMFIHHKKANHPLSLLRTIGSSASAHVSIDHGIKGPVFATCSACSTAAHAIGLAFQMIRAGLVDVAVAGASEAALSYGSLRAWQAMRVLSPDGIFPFTKRRNGTVLSEGAGILFLEEMDHAKARGANILGEVVGFGMTSDAGDMVNPNVEGPSSAMRIALEDAALTPKDIDYLNAHGTATAANDVNETRAIKAVFGEHANRLSISSTKSMHGHLLGAGGGAEAIICLKAGQEGFVPATIGFDEPGDECDLDYTPNEGRKREIRYSMSNSFAFGGLNAVLVFAHGA